MARKNTRISLPCSSSSILEKRFWSGVKKEDKCWIWIGSKTLKNYGKLYDRGRVLRAHRISWGLHYGLIPDRMNVLHKCDNPPCIRPDHLFLGTHQDNSDDMVNKLRTVHGSKHHRSKLSELKVKEIFRLRDSGMSQRKIGAIFGVSKPTIRYVLTGKTWRHVSGA